MMSRSNGSNHSSSRSNNFSYNSYHNSNYSDVRNNLDLGRIEDAQTILDGIPKDMRDAEWYYLKGVIFYKRG